MGDNTCIFYSIENLSRNQCPQILLNYAKSYPILDKLTIISRTSKTESTFAGAFNARVKSYPNFLSLIEGLPLPNKASKLPFKSASIHAVSSHDYQEPRNQVTYNTNNDTLKFQVTESIFRHVPFFNRSRKIAVKKIVPTKNSPNLITTLQFAVPRSRITDDVKQLITVLFDSVDLDITTLNTPELNVYFAQSNIQLSQTILKSGYLNSKIDVASLGVDSLQVEDLDEFYEFLTLVHLQSRQLTTDLNSVISIYQPPQYASSYTVSHPLMHQSVRDVDSSALTNLFEGNLFDDWISLSANANDTNLLIYNTPGDKVYIWRAQ